MASWWWLILVINQLLLLMMLIIVVNDSSFLMDHGYRTANAMWLITNHQPLGQNRPPMAHGSLPAGAWGALHHVRGRVQGYPVNFYGLCALTAAPCLNLLKCNHNINYLCPKRTIITQHSPCINKMGAWRKMWKCFHGTSQKKLKVPFVGWRCGESEREWARGIRKLGNKRIRIPSSVRFVGSQAGWPSLTFQ